MGKPQTWVATALNSRFHLQELNVLLTSLLAPCSPFVIAFAGVVVLEIALAIHRGPCTMSVVLGREGCALESATVRVCR